MCEKANAAAAAAAATSTAAAARAIGKPIRSRQGKAMAAAGVGGVGRRERFFNSPALKVPLILFLVLVNYISQKNCDNK